MLLVGVHRHGFEWERVRVDGELGLPFTLAAGSVPQGSHLLRRLEYLLGFLVEGPCDNGRENREKTRPRRPDTQPTPTTSTKTPINKSIQLDVKAVLKPVKQDVDFINRIAPENIDASLEAICDSVRRIGDHIKGLGAREQREVWRVVASIWPTEMSGPKVASLYGKITRSGGGGM
jgi:hypothetical protein